MPFLALQGVRVLELAFGIAGPFCGKLLADYGAEVIKIEPPGRGDPSRRVGAFPAGDGLDMEKGPLFLHLNTNKRGVTLDLESDRGRDVLRSLAAESDILVESFAPGTMERMGLGYEVLRDLRPHLVMTSVTPYGQTGPQKDYQFTELTVFATSGAMYREGLPEREPLRYGGEIAQYFAGTAAATATTAASLAAAMTGRGRWIDLSIQESMAGHPHQIGRRAPFVYGGELDLRKDPRTTAASGREPYAVGTFRCKDGYVSFLPLGDHMWPDLARMIDRDDLIDSPLYRTASDRTERRKELEAIFQEWFDRHTREEVFAVGQSHGVPCAPVLTAGEVIANEHFRERGYFIDIEHPDVGTLAYAGYPFRFPNTSEDAQHPAPRLGQHNVEVLGEVLGLGGEEIRELQHEGVV